MNKIIKIAQEVFEIESAQIFNLSKLLTEDFELVIESILNCSGKIIVSGMGKSGLIANKIAATLASTGTPSFFLHPAEAFHGDLGMIESDDMLILLSYSGETDEILKIIPFLNSQGNIIVSISGNSDSTLVKNSKYHLNTYVKDEACPLSLAPTSSTTAMLVMGDAIAVALMKLRNFKDENFARFHPGGSLGRKLLTTVDTIMQKTNLPVICKNSLAIDVVHSITNGRCGLTVIVENDDIVGIITDGDLRRHMEVSADSFFNLYAKDMMSINPKIITKDMKISLAEELMKNNNISSLLVEDKKKLVGIVKIYDFHNKIM